MAAGTQFISVPGSGGVPEDYLVSGAAAIDLLSVSATFDGSGAGSDFMPAVQILDEADRVVATMVGDTVTAGDSREVTFAPFLGRSGSGAAGDFVEFDVHTSTGDFLDVLTAGPSGDGLTLKDNGGAADLGILIEEVGDAPVTIQAAGLGGLSMIDSGDGGTLIADNGNGGLAVINNGTGGLRITNTASDIQLIAFGGRLQFDVQFFNLLIMNGLPLASPGVPGAVWINAGVLNIDP